MKISEHDIQSQIIQILEWHKWYVIRINSGVSMGSRENGKRFFTKFYTLISQKNKDYQNSGLSDLIALKNIKDIPRVLFLEIKKPKGKQSDSQIEFEKSLEQFNLNSIYHVFDDCLKLEQFIKEMETI